MENLNDFHNFFVILFNICIYVIILKFCSKYYDETWKIKLLLPWCNCHIYTDKQPFTELYRFLLICLLLHTCWKIKTETRISNLRLDLNYFLQYYCRVATFVEWLVTQMRKKFQPLEKSISTLLLGKTVSSMISL